MGNSHRRVLDKNNLIFVLIFPLIIGSLISPTFGEEDKKVTYGLGILGGFRTASPRLSHYAILPRMDIFLHRNWDLEFEGNFSRYNIREEKDLVVLGTNVNILFKPLQGGWGALFILGGAGLGYDNSGGKVREIGDSHLGGVLQTGVGICIALGKGWLLRGEYRFHHVSEPFKRDTGLNMHDFILGISY